MAVKFDAVGAGITGTASFNTSLNLTESHTASGLDRAVAVAIASINASQAPNTQTRAVTYGGITMPSLVEVDVDAATFLEIFGLLKPPTGAQTVSVTVSSATNTGRQLVFNSVSYTGVKAFGPVNTNTGNSAAGSLTVPSSVGEMIFQAFATLLGQSAYTQTQRYNQQVPSNTDAIMIGDALGAASVVFGNTIAGATTWAAASARMLPVLPDKMNLNQARNRASRF